MANLKAKETVMPKVMLPQESRSDAERLTTLINDQKIYMGITELWAMKIFMQGMEFQKTLDNVVVA